MFFLKRVKTRSSSCAKNADVLNFKVNEIKNSAVFCLKLSLLTTLTLHFRYKKGEQAIPGNAVTNK
jgi:hypothetical protein